MGTDVKVKKWGNSLGFVLPKEFAEKRRIEKGDVVHIEVFKKADFSDVFGSSNTGMTGQEFKNKAREGWD